MSEFVLKKGFDLDLPFPPKNDNIKLEDSEYVVFHPHDIVGIKTRLLVNEGDLVLVGSPLYIDKNNPKVNFVSSVSGVVEKINFGNRRSVLDIVIKNDAKYEYVDSNIKLDYSMSSDQIKGIFSDCGIMTFIRQFPFSKVANPDLTPKCIIVSMFNSAPCTPESSIILTEKNIDKLKKGLSYISKLTDGKVHLNCMPGTHISFAGMPKNIQVNYFDGPHPAGNPGIQIHHIDPIQNKNDIVWSVSYDDVISIGETISLSKYHNRKTITIGGADMAINGYADVLRGCQISSLFSDVDMDEYKIISGDVLSGKAVNLLSGLGHLHSSVSIIKSGVNNREFLGWILPGLSKPSLSRTFLSALNPKSVYSHTDNLNGSLRAIIPFGRWEKMLPMDIYPDFLVKSIIAKDIDMMENLGIYECVPEDFALCSYVCQSKIEVSNIIQYGLECIEVEG